MTLTPRAPHVAPVVVAGASPVLGGLVLVMAWVVTGQVAYLVGAGLLSVLVVNTGVCAAIALTHGAGMRQLRWCGWLTLFALMDLVTITLRIGWWAEQRLVFDAWAAAAACVVVAAVGWMWVRIDVTKALER